MQSNSRCSIRWETTQTTFKRVNCDTEDVPTAGTSKMYFAEQGSVSADGLGAFLSLYFLRICINALYFCHYKLHPSFACIFSSCFIRLLQQLSAFGCQHLCHLSLSVCSVLLGIEACSVQNCLSLPWTYIYILLDQCFWNIQRTCLLSLPSFRLELAGLFHDALFPLSHRHQALGPFSIFGVGGR